MPDYSKGKIYKLVSSHLEKCYIGSTTQPLARRKGGHKADYKKYLENKSKGKCTSFDFIKQDDCDIILIEEYPCENKEQLHMRERFYIEQLECVNKNIPTRKMNEYSKYYYEANKDKIKEYYKNNQEKRKEALKIYRKNHKEEIKKYVEDNKDRIKENHKKYYEDHKEEIRNYKKSRQACECGSTYSRSHKLRHIKSKTHIKLLAEQAEK